MVTWVYSVIMLTAIVCCSWLLRRFQKRLPIEKRDKLILGLAAFTGAMLGAKLPFVIADPENIFTGTTWLANGKTIMFGIVGGYFCVELFKKLLGIKARTGDSFAFPVAIAVAIGRLACFTAGCCFGVETRLPWGVHFSVIDTDSTVLRHPIQIYESIFHFTVAIIILIAYRRLYDPDRTERTWFDLVFHGNLLKAYILVYLLFRFVTEFIRPEPTLFGSLSVYQATSAILFPVFATLWLVDVLKRFRLNSQLVSQKQPQ